MRDSGSERAKVSHMSPPKPQRVSVSAGRGREVSPQQQLRRGKKTASLKTNAGRAFNRTEMEGGCSTEELN